MRANCWMGRSKMQVDEVPDPQILNAPGRDRADHVDRDLRLGPAPLQRLRADDGEGRHPRPRVHGRGRRGRAGGRATCASATASSCRSRSPAALLRVRSASCSRCCENSNPNAWHGREAWATRPPASSATRTCSAASPAARPSTRACRSPTSGRSRSPDDLADEQVLFLSDIFPTGYMGAEMCDIKPGDVVAVWGCGPGRASSRSPARSCSAPSASSRSTASTTGCSMAAEQAGAETINYEEVDVQEALQRADRRPRPRRVHRRRRHGGAPRHGAAVRLRPGEAGARCSRPTGRTRCARRSWRAATAASSRSSASTAGFIDKFPMGAVMNRSLTHPDRAVPRAALHAAAARADPARARSTRASSSRHRLPLDEAPHGYEIVPRTSRTTARRSVLTP